MSSNFDKDALNKVYTEKLTDYERFMYGWVTYHGGDIDYDAYAYVRYNSVAPSQCGVSLSDKRHKSVEDFQYRMEKCHNCNSEEIYLSKFNCVDLQAYGFGYKKVENEYYCPNCSLEYQVKGKWSN